MVPMGSQEYFGFGRGTSGLHWGRCNGRGPHLELRREPQDSCHILTTILGCVWHFSHGLRFRLVWGHGTLLSSQVVRGVSGLQAS